MHEHIIDVLVFEGGAPEDDWIEFKRDGDDLLITSLGFVTLNAEQLTNLINWLKKMKHEKPSSITN